MSYVRECEFENGRRSARQAQAAKTFEHGRFVNGCVATNDGLSAIHLLQLSDISTFIKQPVIVAEPPLIT